MDSVAFQASRVSRTHSLAEVGEDRIPLETFLKSSRSSLGSSKEGQADALEGLHKQLREEETLCCLLRLISWMQ